MQYGCDAGRYERMHPAQGAKFDEPRPDLRRANQCRRRDRGRRARPGDLEQMRQVGRHRSGHEPGRGEYESQQRHRAARGRRGIPSLTRAAGAARAGSGAGLGQSDQKCMAAHTRHQARQPKLASKKADNGHPTVLAKPAIRVMPVMGPRASRP